MKKNDSFKSIGESKGGAARILVIIGIIIGIIQGVVICLAAGVTDPEKYFTGAVVSTVFTLIALFSVKITLEMALRKLKKQFNADMEFFKKGDFSHYIESKSYGDLSGIASAVNTVLSDVRTLIEGFFSLSLSIMQASRQVISTSGNALKAMEEISKTVDEIAKGASDQAAQAEQGVCSVEKLSEQINVAYGAYNDVTGEIRRINTLNSAGLEAVHILRSKSQETFSAAQHIFSVVENLVNKTRNIGLFVESIENIAGQTNLLALNAAIEAARAGEAGRGFAVVADEVRKLADQSRQSTEEISNLVESIQEETSAAIQSLDQMKNVSRQQGEAVNKTDSAFNDIANAINSIIGKIANVNSAMSRMESGKNEVISAIENISSVSEETAASSQEVAATTEQQLKAIEDMKEAATTLDGLVHELNKKLKNYKVK